MKLTPQQAEAVYAPLTPLLVLAGPGSGKTLVLTRRVAHLIQSGLQPDRLFVATFTNKAADELKERLSNLVGEDQSRRLWAGTFHSLSARILRPLARRIGRSSKFSIYDESDARRLVAEAMRAEGITGMPEGILAKIQLGKTRLQSFQDVENDPELARVWQRYEQALAEADALDFGDLILALVRLMQRDEAAAQAVRSRFDHLLVDEVQDINLAQARLLGLMGAEHRSITCVGDPDQGIFSFQGGDLAPVLTFERAWPHAKVIHLNENFRSQPVIVEASRALIARNSTHIPRRFVSKRPRGPLIEMKTCFSELDEADWVAERIRSLIERGTDPDRIAILYRSSWLTPPLERSLSRERIPFTLVHGRSFLEHREIRAVLACLRLLHNPSDAMAFRQVCALRGVPSSCVSRVMELASERDLSFVQIVEGLRFESGFKSFEISRLREVVGLYRRWMNSVSLKLADLIHTIVETADIEGRAIAQSPPEEAYNVRRRLAMLEAMATDYEDRIEHDGKMVPLDGFLGEMVLSEGERLSGEDRGVRLMTIHKAKGLEFQAVFVPGLNDDVLPHRLSMETSNEQGFEEERRLMYVACTRAAERLFLSFPLTRQVPGDRIEMCRPSPFLYEIPSHLVTVQEVS